jgi:clan AA aspartic protease
MTKLKLSNSTDRDKAAEGLLPPDQVRSIEIEALVDTGATTLALPRDVVARLGLPVAGTRRAKDAQGIVIELPWVGSLMIEILGRRMFCDALVIPEGATALIGQIPLEGLDLIVDPKSREVRVNPESPDMPILDLRHVA